MESPDLSSIHSTHSQRANQELDDLSNAGVQLTKALAVLSNIQAQAKEYVQRVEDFAAKRDADLRLPVIEDPEPFSLTIGSPSHVPNSSLFSLPLTIKNETLRKQRAVVLVSSAYGFQDALNIGELEAGQVTKVIYEISTVEEVVFEVVSRTSKHVFRPPDSDKHDIHASIHRARLAYPYDTNFSKEKVFIKIQRSNLSIGEVTLVNEIMNVKKKIKFEQQAVEVFCFVPLMGGPKQAGSYKEIWHLKHEDNDCGAPLEVHYTVLDQHDSVPSSQSDLEA